MGRRTPAVRVVCAAMCRPNTRGALAFAGRGVWLAARGRTAETVGGLATPRAHTSTKSARAHAQTTPPTHPPPHAHAHRSVWLPPPGARPPRTRATTLLRPLLARQPGRRPGPPCRNLRRRCPPLAGHTGPIPPSATRPYGSRRHHTAAWRRPQHCGVLRPPRPGGRRHCSQCRRPCLLARPRGRAGCATPVASARAHTIVPVAGSHQVV